MARRVWFLCAGHERDATIDGVYQYSLTTERTLTLAINPAACLKSLAANERSYLGIPAPQWMAQDPLLKSFSRYPDLWFGGTVVWGRIVQVNQALFADGDGDSPGEIVYDPTGKLGHKDLAEVATKLFALKGTAPADPALRVFADHLTDESARAFGMRVPQSLSHQPLRMSTVLFHRKHLPGEKIKLLHFPVLINEKFPGVVMPLPSRWWPQDLLNQSAGDAHTSLSKSRLCSHCKEPMRKLGLAAHYKRKVEIDVCEPCSLIWFDDTESTRLAGPGLADLVRIIHDAMQQPRPLQPLPQTLQCPICAKALKRVSNITRYGRTAQLECPDKHGSYQSFALFLAEKGYFRPFTWADFKSAVESGKRLACFNCGATLPARPHEECEYCKSPVGLIDPARLASAIDTQHAAPGLQLAPTVKQSECPCCGGAIELSGEMVCPHCRAIVRPAEMEKALAASEAVARQVRGNYESQTTEVSRSKLDFVARSDAPVYRMSNLEGMRRNVIVMITVLSLGFIGSKFLFRSVDMTERNPDGRPLGMNPDVWEGIKEAKREKDMAQIPHAAPGVVPRELDVVKNGDHSVTLTNRSSQRLKVAADLVVLSDNTRCKMKSAGPSADAYGAATFDKPGESHVFTPEACTPKFLTTGTIEYRVWSLDQSRYLFKSDSAF